MNINTMIYISKLTFKSVARAIAYDPITARRDKLVAAPDEQNLVLASALADRDHFTERT